MPKLTFEIDGAVSPPPIEYRGLQIQLNFEGDNTVNVIGGSEVIQGELSTTQFTFANENADKLNARLLPGSLGVFWGVPLKAYKENLIVLDAFIDLTKNPTFGCAKVTANITERKQKDWLNAIADGFDYRFLESLGQISSSDFLKMQYVVSSVPDYKEALILSLTGFVLFVELNRTIKDLNNILSDLSGVFSTIAGVLKLIYFVVYLGLLIYAITKLIRELVFLFIQPVKYHYAMTNLKHWEIACSHLGLTFSSSYYQDAVPTNSVDKNGTSIASGLWKDTAWMPIKSQVGAFRNGTPLEQGYFEGTFGDWIREQILELNGKVFIIGNTLHFERRDFKSSSTSYQIPDTKRISHGINVDEFSATTLLEFQLDQLDTNTVTRIDGTNVKTTVTSINSGVDGAQTLGGLIQYKPACALGRRKDTLTEIEIGLVALFTDLQPIINALYAIAQVVVNTVASVVRAINRVIRAINTLPNVNINSLSVPNTNFARLNIANSISNRIGMLSLSSDFTGQPKLLQIEGSGEDVKIPVNAQTFVSAENIMDKYYYIESFVPSLGKPLAKQKYIWKVENVPFCKEDFELIRGLTGVMDGEAQIISPEGNPAEIKSILWDIWTDTADILYAEPKLYDTNIQLVTTKNTGA